MEEDKGQFSFPKCRGIIFISLEGILKHLPQPTKSEIWFSFPFELFQSMKPIFFVHVQWSRDWTLKYKKFLKSIKGFASYRCFSQTF